MTTLISMRPEFFPAFLALAAETYASENVASGRWPAEVALELARKETERLLPQGLETPKNYLLEVLDAEAGPTVGFVWFASTTRGSASAAFIYQIYVEPQARGQGHARAALVAVETYAQSQGMAAVLLHVFSHNTGAQALYRSVGYSVASLNMHKLLPPGDA